jgi:hypothetical protein
MDPSSVDDRLSTIPPDRPLAQVDRDVARSFLNALSTMVSYAPIPMRVAQIGNRHSTGSEIPEGNAAVPMALPSNAHLSPAFYCDVIVETVTEYDSK